MGFTVQQSQVRIIRSDDPGFMIQDTIVMAPRAGFEINLSCPREYRMIISECIKNGWLKPIAHVTEKEYLWMNLSK